MSQTLNHQLTGERLAGPTAQSVTADGVLVAEVELARRYASYEPHDHLFLLRAEEVWSAITISRTERWEDEGGAQWPASGQARVSVQPLGALESVVETIRDRYGESGWRQVLEAGHANDPDLYCRWIPIAVEADLDAAVFYRRDLAGRRAHDKPTLMRLRREVEAHLAEAGLRVVTVGPPPRRTRQGENDVVARAVVQRSGYQFGVIVRIDDAGEVYPRLVDLDDGFGPAIGPVANDDL